MQRPFFLSYIMDRPVVLTLSCAPTFFQGVSRFSGLSLRLVLRLIHMFEMRAGTKRLSALFFTYFALL